MHIAPVRGAERSYVKWNCSLLMSKENQKTTSDFDALDALCELTGENASEAVINEVFERFCVGK